MVEVPIKDDCGSYKFNITKFETKDGCFLAVTGAECWRPDVNVSFDDTVETLYDKLTDDGKDTSCFSSGCTVSAEESEEKIYQLSKDESCEQTYFNVYFKKNIASCPFSASVRELWAMIKDITKPEK
jgi:hypothetical protein